MAGMLSDKKLFLFDIDGTVCRGNALITGTKELLEDIKIAGGQFVFITNNATRSINDYIKKFKELGIDTQEKNFVTASYAAVDYLKRVYPGKLIYVMGTTSFMAELEQNGIRITTDPEDERIACVLATRRFRIPANY